MAGMIRAGLLDRRVSIERASVTVDAFGAEVPTWRPLATVWAAKEDVRDSERFAAAEVSAEITTRFRLRWSHRVADLTPRDRVNHNGRIYQIVAVKEIPRRQGIEITATARAD